MKYILLRIEDDDDARLLVEEAAEYPDSPLLTPWSEHEVYARIVTVLTGRPAGPDGCIRCGCIVGHNGRSCGGRCGGDAQGLADRRGLGGIRNTITGSVTGTVIQAGDTGPIHF